MGSVCRKMVNGIYYIAFDMEWNQPGFSGNAVMKNGTVLYGEIIQIGAVKLNEAFEPIDSFKANIKPTIYRKIKKRIEAITKISTASAKNGIPWEVASKKFFDWCGNDFAFLTWGCDDIKILKDNLKFFGMSETLVPKRNYDLQLIFDYLTQKKCRQFSLDFAMEYYEISETTQRHNAYNDAYYTALICKKMNPTECFENYRSVFLDRFTYDSENSGGSYVKKVDVFDGQSKLKFFRQICSEKVVCPICSSEAKLEKKFRKGESNYALVYKCKDHGFFITTLNFRTIEDFDALKAIRNTYLPGEDAQQSIKSKTKKWKAI